MPHVWLLEREPLTPLALGLKIPRRHQRCPFCGAAPAWAPRFRLAALLSPKRDCAHAYKCGTKTACIKIEAGEVSSDGSRRIAGWYVAVFESCPTASVRMPNRGAKP